MILLINPRTSKTSGEKLQFFREPNLGLLYLAAILDLNEIPVDILDLEQFRDLNQSELRDLVKERIKGYKIFGITSLTNTFHIALDIVRIIKNQDKNNFIILGGPHVSFMYKEILKYDNKTENLIDFICIGESENSFLTLVKYLMNTALSKKNLVEFETRLKSIRGLAFVNSKGRININNPTDEIDLENLPLPARYKLSLENYYYDVANVIINRGCPNQCSFCSRQKLFKTTRIRSIESILTEIRDILSLQTYNYINFYDNINLNRKFFRDFCNMFVENRILIPWGCELRVDTISFEEARLLKKAGCKLVATGIESANKKVLEINFKYQDPIKVRTGIKNLKKCGISLQAYFVLGLPGETEDSFYQTGEYIKSLPLNKNDKLNYFIATPYPGSRLWDEKESYNITIVENDFAKFDCEHIIFETKDLKIEKLKQLLPIAKKIEREVKKKNN